MGRFPKSPEGQAETHAETPATGNMQVFIGQDRRQKAIVCPTLDKCGDYTGSMAKLLLILLSTVALLAAQDTAGAVRRVLQDQADAWNRGDIESFMHGYENSEQTTFVGKSVSKGYNKVLEDYRRRYSTAEKMGALTFSDIEVTPLGSGYASVLGRFYLKRTPSGGGDATGLFTLLFKNTDAGWKIILDHTSS